MNRCPLLLAVALMMALPSAAAAQMRYDEPTRQTFTFLGDRLTVLVQVDVPGTIRLIRGQDGRLDVAGLAPNGLASFGLSSKAGNELQLAAVGTDSVQFVVVVPEDTRVLVRLPGRHVAEVFGTLDRAATYRWRGRND